MKDSTKTEPIVYTVKEVAALLHTNVGLVYQLINMGLLPAIRLGSLRVRKEALDAFLEKFEGYDLHDLQNIKPLCCI